MTITPDTRATIRARFAYAGAKVTRITGTTISVDFLNREHPAGWDAEAMIAGVLEREFGLTLRVKVSNLR
jgi:hypothetical protein